MLAFKFDKETGEWRASIEGYYHAVGFTKDQAVRRLGAFLRHEHPEVFAQYEGLLNLFFETLDDTA